MHACIRMCSHGCTNHQTCKCVNKYIPQCLNPPALAAAAMSGYQTVVFPLPREPVALLVAPVLQAALLVGFVVETMVEMVLLTLLLVPPYLRKSPCTHSGMPAHENYTFAEMYTHIGSPEEDRGPPS